MKIFKMKEEVINTIINEQNILIVQDLDGVCMISVDHERF